MRRIAFVAALLSIGSAAGHSVADDSDPLAGLSGARALEFATDLSSDAMQGRRSGAASGRRAEDWMAAKLREIGLAPLGPYGRYAKSFSFGTSIVSSPIALTVGDKTADYGIDYVDLLYTGGGTVEAEVVFVGYGISAKDRGLDDYEGIDVKGKVVLALRGAPPAREAEFTAEKFIGAKSSLAADRGAAAFLICEGATAVPGTIQDRFVRPDLPALWIRGGLADVILKGPAGTERETIKTLDDLKKELVSGTVSRSFATGVRVRVEVHAKHDPNARARNVVGGFPGTDPVLGEETILIGAHLDHLGVDATGRVFNGADDNASGSSSLLMLAETLAKNHWQPRRTVVFAWFAGEEQGLAGSRALAADPDFLDRPIVAMLNMDMTGQGKPAVKLGGRDGYPALWKRMLSFLPPADLTVLNPFRVEENSDHWPFYERGIPSFFAVTDGDHPNYHQLGDDAVNLNPDCLEAASRVVGRMLVGLADVGTPLHTGYEAATYVLHEGARVVGGPASAQALDAMLARPHDAAADRAAFVDPGWSAVIVPIDERAPADGATFEKLLESIRRRASEAALVRTAGDLVNAPKAGRTAVLPRVVCPDSARKPVVDFSALRKEGVRWIEPFEASHPPTDAERDAVLTAAVAARLIVDLTGLPEAALAPARATLKSHPATFRRSGPPTSGDRSAAAALADLRRALGPHTLLLLSGGAEDALLARDALSVPDEPMMSPIAVVSEDTARLEEALAPASHDLDDPRGVARLRVRSLFGGAIADLLRRVP